MTAILRTLVAGFPVHVPVARSFQTTGHYSSFIKSSPGLRISSTRLLSSSYEIDSDEEAEQHLADKKTSDDATNLGHGARRYSSVLESVGIDPKTLKQFSNLSEKRTVSPNDVFCNRELQMSGISAIGFDMDYTLAQYKQPAFDKLAFDGAKAKLVEQLGYPEAVMELAYDHTVSYFFLRSFLVSYYTLCLTLKKALDKRVNH
jgi:hypothetical protein